MAKGSAMGLWKGKKGSSVFYQIKNSNSLQKQGIRERNYEPSNPQSSAQAGQRMRMYPAQAVYGVLKYTIERSWQGVKYGQMTRQAYLKSALREPLFPAIVKGDSAIVPGPYQISKGTLQEVEATVSEGRFVFPLFAVGTFDWDSTLAELSKAILDNNSFLEEGDQLSFVLCHTNLNSEGFYWNVISFYLNTQASDVYLGNIFDNKIKGEEVVINGEGISFVSGDHIFMAAACVISREGATPMRSTARLACDYQAADMQKYYSTAAQAEAKRSYMKQLSTAVTDWPVDPSEEDSGDDTINITVSQISFDSNGEETSVPGGTVSGGGSYLPGETVWLVATPSGTNTFQGWYPSAEDARNNTNRISANANFGFDAGGTVVTSTTIFGRFNAPL